MGSRSVSPPTGDVYVLVEGRVLLHTLIQSSTWTQGLPSPEVAPEFGMTTKLQQHSGEGNGGSFMGWKIPHPAVIDMPATLISVTWTHLTARERK